MTYELRFYSSKSCPGDLLALSESAEEFTKQIQHLIANYGSLDKYRKLVMNVKNCSVQSQTVFDILGTINADLFFGFPPKSVMLTGFQKDEDDCVLQFQIRVPYLIDPPLTYSDMIYEVKPFTELNLTR